MATQSLKEGRWPNNVGIVAMEVYFPSVCVDQVELEKHDQCGAGKYTIGLGQTNMGFCTDREDIHSLALTVVQSLMDKNNVSYSDIGRMEVGTETIIDKSKSVKTVLMKLFTESGNTNIEGIDTTNACFGGTQALFNSVAWVESSAWDGRFGLVVCADIAVYASGNARPTGGAGAVAMLIGPNAPIILERGMRAIHMEHVYDFYKPNLSSEFPVVDGKLSISCYLNALDKCYEQLAQKSSSKGANFTLDSAEYFCFHSPFTKLVQKSLARLMLNDFLKESTPETGDGGKYAGLEKYRGRTLQDTLYDKEVERAMVKASETLYKAKTFTSTLLGREVGNMYTASVYGGLASLLACNQPSDVAGKRVVMFSYGSGLASSLYCLRISDDCSPSSPLSSLMAKLSDVPARLKARKVLTPSEFEAVMKLREDTHHKSSYEPVSSPDDLAPGTYYLTLVDDMFRRTYKRVPPNPLPSSIPPLAAPIRAAVNTA